jgi:MoaA/NifB/PqqE/SkfB family radical SAM enzyme
MALKKKTNLRPKVPNQKQKTIAFSITSKCEENCAYCFRKPQKDTTLQEFKKQLTFALKQNPELKKIAITGGNPELNKDFWEICKAVKAKKTNGAKGLKEAKGLKDANKLKLKIHSTFSNHSNWVKFLGLVDEVSIPIDSLNPVDGLRSPASLKNSLEAFDYFLGKKEMKIQVHTVVSKKNAVEENFKQLEEMKDFLLSKNFFDNSFCCDNSCCNNSAGNTWKVFRLIGNEQTKKFELSASGWTKVKKFVLANVPSEKVMFVENVLDY